MLSRDQVDYSTNTLAFYPLVMKTMFMSMLFNSFVVQRVLRCASLYRLQVRVRSGVTSQRFVLSQIEPDYMYCAHRPRSTRRVPFRLARAVLLVICWPIKMKIVLHFVTKNVWRNIYHGQLSRLKCMRVILVSYRISQPLAAIYIR